MVTAEKMQDEFNGKLTTLHIVNWCIYSSRQSVIPSHRQGGTLSDVASYIVFDGMEQPKEMKEHRFVTLD